MRKTLFKVLAGAVLVGLLAVGGAQAVKIEIGKTTVSATATIVPRTLPAKGNQPVSLSSVIRIGTKGGPPPMLKQLNFKFDGNGRIDTKGLPVCTLAKLAETTPGQARKRCAGAIVGEGTGHAEVALPGQPATKVSSPLTFFNAPPQGGKPSMIAHAYETIPAPKTLLVPFSIERIKQGRYGYQAKIELPPIAEGYGGATLAEATIGKTWKRGGKSVGYVSAHCSGGRLQVYGTMSFADGSYFPATLTSPCHVPG